MDPIEIALIAASPLLLLLSRWLQLLALVAFVAWYTYFRPVKEKVRINSIVYGTKERDSDMAHRPLENYPQLATYVWGFGTVPEIFNEAVKKNKGERCLGWRKLLKVEKVSKQVEVKGKMETKQFDVFHYGPYEWITYDNVAARVRQTGSGLAALGLRPRDKVSIFANTSADWQISFQACMAYNFPVVTVYASLGAEALSYGFNQTKVGVVLTETSLLKTLYEAIAASADIHTVVFFEENEAAAERAKQEFNNKNPKIRLLSMREVVARASNEPPTEPPRPEDVAVIMYTSGSTGNPKGVVVTQANLVACISGLRTFVERLNPTISKGDDYIAFLPLAHILEVAAETTVMTLGASVGYASTKTLTGEFTRDQDGKPCGDIEALRPSLMAAVPAILDKLRDGIRAKAKKQGFAIAALLEVALHQKGRAYAAGGSTLVWDKLVFDKIKANFGGRLKYIVSGGAPLSIETQRFLNLCVAPVLQGYGLTETCASGCIVNPADHTFGHVGGPMPSCEIKLKDVPEMNYLHTNKPPQGEILIRGGPVTREYYEEPEKTAEVYVPGQDGQGVWFHTGDIGEWLENGALRIIDRKKDLVKMVQGEYIALGRLEAIFRNSPLVENIMVYVNSLKDAPVAVVVPREAALEALAKQQGAPIDLPAMCNNPALVAEVAKSIEAEGKKAGIHKFEYLRKIFLTPDVWTPQSGLLTEALKLKRKPVTDKYKEQLERLYD